MALVSTIGGATSDTYATLAEYQAFAATLGYTLSGVDATDEINLRKAVKYLDNAYRWVGYPTSATQALAWPRFTEILVDNYQVRSDTIPQPIKDAQMEMAYLLQQGATPFASLTGGAIERKREKVDVIEEETVYSRPRERDAYPLIDGLVADYTIGKRGVAVGSISIGRG